MLSSFTMLSYRLKCNGDNKYIGLQVSKLAPKGDAFIPMSRV